MSKFVLLMHENPSDFASVSPDEIQSVISEYVDWRKKLATDGKLSGGNKLKEEGGKNLKVKDGHLSITDVQFIGDQEILGGYFIIDAPSYEDAIDISKTCPHLKYGGRIELREVEQTG